jgi:two-component system NtrC family sensor kinase
MGSDPQKELEVEDLFDLYKEPVEKSPKIDVILEHYLSLVGALKKDLNLLRDDLSLEKRKSGDLSDSLEEYLSIQKLASAVSQNLEIREVIEHLNEVTRRLIPLIDSEVFLLEGDKFYSCSSKKNKDLDLIVSCARDEGIIQWLWDQGHPMVVPLADFMIYEQLKRRKGNVILVPMLDNRQGMGIFVLLTHKEQSNFTIRDLELLNVFVQQASLAIQYHQVKQAEMKQREQLRQMQSRLMHVMRSATVSELAGGFAHEINNPLQIIMGNAQMARMGHRLEESLEIIEKQSMRIANIVRGLLNMTRHNNDSETQYLEINPLIVNTLNLIRGQIEKRSIKIELNLDQNIPVVQCGAIYFQQILLNFILHAKMQIGHNGTIQIKSYAEDKSKITLEITDSGVPLPDEYISKIMDPFSELENSTEVNLGLTVSVQMVKEIGGDVQIRAAGKSGNRVIMTIPTVSVKVEEENGKVASLG